MTGLLLRFGLPILIVFLIVRRVRRVRKTLAKIRAYKQVSPAKATPGQVIDLCTVCGEIRRPHHRC